MGTHLGVLRADFRSSKKPRDMHTTRKSAIERRNRQPVLKHLLSHLGMQAMADSQKARENQLVAAALIAKKSSNFCQRRTESNKQDRKKNSNALKCPLPN